MNTLPAFDWHLVPGFLAVLEHGSLLAAARALQVSQPTLGRHVAELEAQLGLSLFERGPRGLLPTEAARRLADAARGMAQAADTLAREAGRTRQDSGGTVRLSASQPVACVLLPPLLASLRRAQPQIQVELVVSNEVSNLLQREADMAVRMVRPDQASLVARRVGEVAVGAYASADYLARRGLPRSPAELLQHDLVGRDRLGDILQGFAAMGQARTATDFVLRTDDFIAYEAAVRAGMGIGFLARYSARQAPALVPVMPNLPIPPLPVWLVVHREIRTSRRIRLVWDHLAQTLPLALAPPADGA